MATKVVLICDYDGENEATSETWTIANGTDRTELVLCADHEKFLMELLQLGKPNPRIMTDPLSPSQPVTEEELLRLLREKKKKKKR